MHESSLKRMQWFKDTYLDKDKRQKILDVGSYNVNGCYKEIFNDEHIEYNGLDMVDGPNVDIVPEKPYKWNEIVDDSYECVISGQALEHIEFFWVTVSEIIRVTKKGGLICIIAPNGFKEHRYPVDCWRFFTDGMVALTKYYQLEIIHAHTNAAPSVEDESWYSIDCADSMLIARKTYSGKAQVTDLDLYKCEPADQDKLMGSLVTFKMYEKNKRETKNEIQKEESSIRGKVKKSLKGYKRLFEKMARRETQ